MGGNSRQGWETSRRDGGVASRPGSWGGEGVRRLYEVEALVDNYVWD